MEEDLEKDYCYIALELAIGTLRNYVEGKHPDLKLDDIGILAQAANGLQWLHSNNISKMRMPQSNCWLPHFALGDYFYPPPSSGFSSIAQKMRRCAPPCFCIAVRTTVSQPS